MRFQSGDAEIVYEERGQGAPVALLHPFPVNHRFWLFLAEILAPRYRLLLPDLRAHGESGVGEGPALMSKHAADLEKLCDTAGVQRAVLVGVSIGGYILFEFWRCCSRRVRALVLSNTRASADTAEGRANRLKSAEEVEQHGTAAFIETMLPRLLGETTRRNRPDRVEEAHKMMSAMTPAGIAALQRGMAERPDSVPTLGTIQVPTLILAGDEDTLTPLPESKLMQQHIAGSRLEVIPRAGHFGPFEQPEEAGRLLRRFLDSLPVE